jgi:glycine/D-amino acid oxidase-like deaminating enzyme
MAGNSSSADCIVVGAGLLGMLTAHFLVREGFSVAVLDRGAACR